MRLAVATGVVAAGPLACISRDAFGPDVPPGTLLGVAALGYDDQLVEVDAIAAVRRQP
jgi:enamine deaminase RidA (YjgF/YER057c/UK114 family)